MSLLLIYKIRTIIYVPRAVKKIRDNFCKVPRIVPCTEQVFMATRKVETWTLGN